MPTTTDNRAKRALLVGIDAYPSLTPLHGCVNDVQLMRGILTGNFGFASENIALLANGEATRDAILAAFDALVATTGHDDIVVIHYAGHGALMTDREGDEPSGYDSTIMPFDSVRDRTENRDITDDEIHLRLIQLGEKTSYITLIFDCCHSGTITRDSSDVSARTVKADTRPIAELPPSPIPLEMQMSMRSSGPSGWLPLDDKYVLIAGCRDDEISYEYRDGEVMHGALSYFLGQELHAVTPGTSYRDIFERASAKVNANRSAQHPQMEGRADREVFGVTDLVPMNYVSVLARNEGAVVMGHGAAQGMTAGSRFAVHPEGTRRSDPATRIGEIEVTAVRATDCDARIISEPAAGAIKANARAFETVHSFGDLKLGVYLVETGNVGGVPAGDGTDPARTAALQSLRDLIDASPLLKFEPDRARSRAHVHLLAARDTVSKADPVPQLASIAAPGWGVVGSTGDLIMPLKSVSAVADVVQNLEKIARYTQALALENPDPTSALRGEVALDLLRKAGDGSWVVAQPEAAGGQVVFEEGEVIAFRITNRHSEDLFVSLIDFGLTGSVGAVPHATVKLAAGISLDVGTELGGRGYTLSMPRNFPFAENPNGNVVEGIETLKLFVTTQPASFAFLAQTGVRSGSSPLELLWQTAIGIVPTRDIVETMPVKGEDWTTVLRPFLLRRRNAVSLSGDATAVPVGLSKLRTPGLSGVATSHSWKSERAKTADLTTDALTQALETAGASITETIEISGTQQLSPASRGSGSPADAPMELSVSDPGPESGQMVMSVDELGVISWHFAPPAIDGDPVPSNTQGARGTTAGSRTYVIPATVAMLPATGPAGRGLVGMVGKKFLKVVVFPLIEPGIGRITNEFASKWEAKHRPYGVRTFSADDYGTDRGTEIDAEGWKRLGAGRSLLMIHGTFSRANSAFGSMPTEYVASLNERYGGRVFAFDHFSLSHDPKENINWLVDRLPDGSNLDVDIICHSRGGLVSRMLAEKQGDFAMSSRKVRVGKVIFAGTPNAGTTLADDSHMGDFIDTYTNLLNFFPGVGIGDILAGIITVAKQIATGAMKGLPGLQSMRPGGDFGKLLNSGSRVGDTRYFALASNFTPSQPGLRELAANRLMDKVFGGANDLVVPTGGVFGENGSGFFPIEDKLVFDGSDGVSHTGFFADQRARQKMMEWLTQ